jgi:hypothetical protein
MKNEGNLRAGAGAGAGAGALTAVIVLLRLCFGALGVVTAEAAGGPDGPRDWLRVRALDCEVDRTLEGAVEGVLDLVQRVVDLPQTCFGGVPIFAGVHLIFFVVQ